MSTTIERAPTSQGPDNNWTAGGAYSKTTAVSDANDSTFNNPNNGTDPDTFNFVALGIDPLSVVTAVKLRSRDNGAVSNDSVTLKAALGAASIVSPAFQWASGTFPTIEEHEYVFSRPGAGVWTVADVDASPMGWGNHNWNTHATPAGIRLQRFVTYLPEGVLLEQVRDVASLFVARYGPMPAKVAIPLAAAFLGLNLGDIVSVAHRLLPTAEGEGRGESQWQRLVGRMYEQEIDLDNLARGPIARFEDMTLLLRRYWDGGRTPREPGATKDGIVILSPGGLRTYDGPPMVARSYVSGYRVKVAEDVEPAGADGRLSEGQAINTVLNSAFVDGLTSWSTVAGAPALDSSSPQYWDPTITNQHLYLTNDTIEQAGIVAAAGWQRFMLAHFEDVADELQVRLLRASDGWSWDPVSGTWVAGSTLITIPSRLVWTEDLIGPIDQTAGSTTYTIRLQTAAGHGSHVALAQLELAQHGKGWSSSPIVTTTAAVTRVANSLKENNDAANRKIRGSRGCVRARLIPFFSSADLVTGSRLYVFAVTHDANNWIRLYYDPAWSPASWVLELRAAGTTYQVPFPGPVVRGTTYSITTTWQGTGGENGDPDHTISIAVSGAPRVTAVAAALAEGASSDWWKASLDGSTGHWNGYVFDETALTRVPTPAENKRWALYG